MLSNLALSLAAVLALLALLEVGFRVFDLRGHFADRTQGYDPVLLPDAERLTGLSRQFRPDSEFELRYDSDPRGYFGPSRGLRYRINRHGFRGPDWSERKAPGTLRLMLLGDSFAFGEGVRFEDTVGERLETRLAQELGSPVEVINVATSGWSTHDEIVYLSALGRHFEADWVVVLYVLNDPGYPTGIDLWEGFRHAYEPPEWLRRSYLLSFVYARVARDAIGRRYVESMLETGRTLRAELWDVSFRRLEQGRKIAERSGARFAVVLFPFLYRLDDGYPFRELHERVRRAVEGAGILFHDLFESFEGRPYADLWVHPSDQHPNEVGHAIAADAMARFLLDAGLRDDGEAGRPRTRPSSSSATGTSPSAASSGAPNR